jgi:type I restriction enzyme M protein
MHQQTHVNKIYDPACGSGSLLLQAKKHFDAHLIEDGFYGQEINHTTYNLARMNLFLHNINYDKFNIQLGDTLVDPHFWEDIPFDAIVSNPPYSLKWIGSDDPTLINDERFAPAGVLAPKSKADFAFVLHALSYLSSKGRAAIVCFPGIFYRGGAEQKIAGATHLVFNAEGQIELHRDYWDAAEELYEKLPVVGSLMRWLKRRANS